MKQFDVIWVDTTLPNSQPRRHFKITGVTSRQQALTEFNTRVSSHPELCASPTDKVIDCVELVPAKLEDINNLITSRRNKKTSHHSAR